MARRLAVGALVLVAVAVGIVVGAFAFERTKTVVETRTVTEQATGGETLHVEIIDYNPQVASGDPAPVDGCALNVRFPDVSQVAAYAAGRPAEVLGELVGVTDQESVSYSTQSEPYGCVMAFEIPDLVESRFYVIHANSERRLFEGGYNWTLSAAALERKDWRARLRLEE